MKYPETTAQLFDLCAEIFGIGQFDEQVGGAPYYKVRAAEIGKLNRIIKARGIEVKSLGVAAHYCSTNGIAIHATTDLLEHILPAYRQLREEEKREKAETLADRVEKAIVLAWMRGQHDTAERLMRMPMAVAADLIDDIERTLGGES